MILVLLLNHTNLKHLSVAVLLLKMMWSWLTGESYWWWSCKAMLGLKRQIFAWANAYFFYIVTQSGYLTIIAYYTNLGRSCSFFRHDLCDFCSHTWLDIWTDPQDLIFFQLKSPLKPTQIRHVLNNPVTYTEWVILRKKWLMLFLIYWSRIRHELS